MRPNGAGVRVASSRVDSDGFWVHAAVKYLASPAVACLVPHRGARVRNAMIAACRHLLVIASQCRRMNQLDQLEEVARELHTALLDEEARGCVPGLPHGRPSLYYDKLSSAEIRVTVEDAIRYAGDQGATLVLALLGHGFTPVMRPLCI